MSTTAAARGLAAVLLLVGGCMILPGCGNSSNCISSEGSATQFGGFGGCVPGGNVPAQTSFQVLGDPGTPFSALISDTKASYNITGTVPLSIIFVNEHPPVRINANKLTGTSALLSLEIVSGTTIVQLFSTEAPFGTVVVQTGTLPQLAPVPGRDVRFIVKAPPGEVFNTLIEDLSNGFEASAVVPALFLFEGATGRVDGEFDQVNNIGPLSIDLIINGALVAQASGGPKVSIVQ